MSGHTNEEIGLVQFIKIGRKTTSIIVAFCGSGAPVIHQSHFRFDARKMDIIKG
jgi:hypothetical protein